MEQYRHLVKGRVDALIDYQTDESTHKLNRLIQEFRQEYLISEYCYYSKVESWFNLHFSMLIGSIVEQWLDENYQQITERLTSGPNSFGELWLKRRADCIQFYLYEDDIFPEKT